ncbi:hypothetical protein [Brevirhabdus sp.]|uniref:hypothetical protein n=1 Tax=Brevirhabdus sp. TaxID=2004514 RepID=UPI0040599D5A
MGQDTKIATCCYCGTRAALVLKGTTRHELSCGSCGAPLHNLKQLRQSSARAAPARTRGARDVDATVRDMGGLGIPAWSGAGHSVKPTKKHRKKHGKPKKLTKKRLAGKIFDALEDLFD